MERLDNAVVIWINHWTEEVSKLSRLYNTEFKLSLMLTRSEKAQLNRKLKAVQDKRNELGNQAKSYNQLLLKTNFSIAKLGLNP